MKRLLLAPLLIALTGCSSDIVLTTMQEMMEKLHALEGGRVLDI